MGMDVGGLTGAGSGKKSRSSRGSEWLLGARPENPRRYGRTAHTTLAKGQLLPAFLDRPIKGDWPMFGWTQRT